jgi:hypothetical protein
MNKALLSGTFFTGLWFAAASTYAQPPTAITACPKGHDPVSIHVEATVSTNLAGCPLLENQELRKLVDKNLSGTTFAYPFVPYTCVSGTNLHGTIGEIEVTGTTESAQRFFPEALAVNPSGGGLFLIGASQDGKAFASGAAATIVSVQGLNESFELQLLLSDRFTLNLDDYPIIDTEDFEVVGSEGASVTGRLTGIAEIYQFPGEAISNADFTVDGQICIK